MAEPFLVPTASQDFFESRSVWDEVNPHEASQELSQRLREALDEIPPWEADIWEMSNQGMSQREIGKVFGITQGGVSYTLRVIRRKLKWILERPPRPPSFEEDLNRAKVNPNHQALLGQYLVRLNFLWVARLNGVGFCKARNAFYETLKKLPEGPTKNYIEYHKGAPFLLGLDYSRTPITSYAGKLQITLRSEGGPIPAQSPKSP